MALWWFLIRDPLINILSYGVDALATGLMADYIIDVVSEDDIWLITTSLSTIDNPLALVGIPIPATRFTVSLPLFWGLALATPAAAHLRHILLGTLILLPVVLLMILMLIQFKLGLYINHQPALTETASVNYVLALPYPDYLYHFMGVGRQLAVLILPTLAPLFVWGLLNKRFIRSVILEGLLTQLNKTSQPASKPENRKDHV